LVAIFIYYLIFTPYLFYTSAYSLAPSLLNLINIVIEEC